RLPPRGGRGLAREAVRVRGRGAAVRTVAGTATHRRVASDPLLDRLHAAVLVRGRTSWRLLRARRSVLLHERTERGSLLLRTRIVRGRCGAARPPAHRRPRPPSITRHGYTRRPAWPFHGLR